MAVNSGVKSSFLGRVRNYPLKPTDPNRALLPIFESIVNSIHSIEELGRKDGKIDIYVERVPHQTNLIETGRLDSIDSFTVVDNGIGFDANHYNAFNTTDTVYKVKKGGKGVGRLSWLKAFKFASIESVYKEENSFYKRAFDFKLTENAVHNSTLEKVDAEEYRTSVKLIQYKSSFREKAPKKPEILANRIIEHCLLTFLKEDAPIIQLFDSSREEPLILNDIFNTDTKVHSKIESFKCRSHVFHLISLRVYSAEDADHRVLLCGQEREVKRENLHKTISFLKNKKRIDDGSGKGFVYVGYISSKYLDDNVNTERTGFDIPDEPFDLRIKDPSKFEIIEESVSRINAYLQPFISSMAKENLSRISLLINTEKLIYKPLLKHKHDRLAKIPYGLTDSELEIELHKIYRDFEIEIKKEAVNFLNPALNSAEDSQQEKEAYLKFIEESNDLGKSKLVEYVVHRKVMLDLLETSLFGDSKNKYQKEEVIHDIIFPQYKTSNDIAYERQNLWIIDEKLSYHEYLASDIELRQYEGLEIDSQSRPDIAIFNGSNNSEVEEATDDFYDKNFVFVPDRYHISSVIIIEFKKPQRKVFEKDPIEQVSNYVKLIQAGKKTDKNKRPILIKPNTPFYAYIICDLSNQIVNNVTNRGFTPSPNNDGYFWYNPRIFTYFEVVSYQKLLTDAKDRNRVLFDKLQISI